MICLRHFAVRLSEKATAGTATATTAAGWRRRRAAAATAWQQGGPQRARGAEVAASAGDKQQVMEVEVKLRLPGPEAHQQLAQLLAPGLVATHQQENYFFDGPGRELGSTRVVLRLRLYDGDKKALLTLKGEQVLVDGIGRASEVEEVLPDAAAARRYLQQPSELLALPSDIMKGLAQRYGLAELVGLGGFSNSRQEAAWRGFTLELDATTYPWGCVYELEAETDKPEELRSQLEELLQSHGIQYSYSTTSKFANFINKTLV
eukprot:GHRQ01015534.1.p1 GENE.GHRQ01015534.1~~GHRQ01015534.1.p1  ORF type:complete len:262 (+),score=144.30 GHRQ01015534.1:295-1080(+)